MGDGAGRQGAITVEWIYGSRIQQWELTSPTQLLSIGREAGCDLCLDSTDRGISRRAASIFWSGGSWWFANISNSRPIDVREPSGLPSVLDTDGRRAIDRSRLTFVITGVIMRHGIRVTRPPDPFDQQSAVDDVDPDRTVAVPVPSPAERAALAAMIEGYLAEFPKWDPQTRTYAQIGARLGLPDSTARKRLESFRTKLQNAGLVGLESPDARQEIAELVLGTRLVTLDDLAAIS